MLDRRHPDGSTERANLESAARQGRNSAAAALIGPPLPADGEHIWAWFLDLAASRGSNGFGANPISWLDVMAWRDLTGTIVRPEEVRAIMTLDRLWLSDQAEHARQTAGTRQPTTPKKQGR